MDKEMVFSVDGKLPERQRTVLEFLLRATLGLVDGDGASVMLLDKGRKTLTIEAAGGRGEDFASKIGFKLQVGERIAGRVAQTGEAIAIVGDVQKDQRFQNTKRYQDIKAGLSVPIKAGNRVVGVLNFKRTTVDKPICDSEIRLLNSLASATAGLLS